MQLKVEMSVGLFLVWPPSIPILWDSQILFYKFNSTLNAKRHFKKIAYFSSEWCWLLFHTKRIFLHFWCYKETNQLKISDKLLLPFYCANEFQIVWKNIRGNIFFINYLCFARIIFRTCALLLKDNTKVLTEK